MSDAASAGFAPRLVFPPGTVVEGKYRIERPLGQGEMGCVFLATHLRNGESLALKFMHPADPSQGPAAFAAFLHAARAAARFRSENVAHVRDMGMLEDGAPFLVMEYLEGGTLDAMLRARGALPVAQSVDLAMEAARGLADAHAAGVIHRDARPSNWFLARVPNGATHVKLLDFGGSRIVPRGGSSEDRRSPRSPTRRPSRSTRPTTSTNARTCGPSGSCSTRCSRARRPSATRRSCTCASGS